DGSEITNLAFELEIRATARRRRHGDANLGQDLVSLKGCCEQRDEEVIDGNRSGPAGTGSDYLGSEREHGRRMIVCRIAVRKVPAHRGHVSNLWVCNETRRVVDYRNFEAIKLSLSKFSSPGTPADCQVAAVFFDVL